MNDVQSPPQESAAHSGLIVDDPLWYKDAVIYQLNVKSFFDSNDDGIGDFKGLTSKLNYIRDLGVNTIRLMPFYQHPWFQAARAAPAGSPQRDFYVWSDTDQKYLGLFIISTATETSNWTW